MGDRAARAWWLRWDGLPPSLELWWVERERRLAGVRGWRRPFVGGSLWVPIVLALSQAVRLPWSRGGELAFRAGATVLLAATAVLTGLARRGARP